MFYQEVIDELYNKDQFNYITINIIGGEGNGGVNDLTGVWEFENNKEEIEISLDNSPIMQATIEVLQLPSPLFLMESLISLD